MCFNHTLKRGGNSMYKEIVTKAVIGKGKKYFKNSYNLLAEHNANTILGCWVINHLLVVGDNHCKIY